MSSGHYFGFSYRPCRSTQNLSFAAWVLYDPSGNIISLQGVFLGRTTSNIVEYSAVIELSSEEVSLDIRDLVVKLDSQLILL